MMIRETSIKDTKRVFHNTLKITSAVSLDYI